MSQTDFNDLHVTQGIQAVREQILGVLNKQQPAANDEATAEQESSPDPTESRGPDIQDLLNRYALAMPDAKVWDAVMRRIVKQGALKAQVGQKLFKEWLEHEARRTVEMADVVPVARAAQTTGDSGIARSLERYVYLYPTDSVWDSEKKDIVPISGLRYAIADHFDDWLKHPNRKVIDRENLVFDPTQQIGEGCINTFRGIQMVPAEDLSRCKNIRRMIGLLCNDDYDVYNWLVRWLALPLQQVGTKMATAVLMHSSVHGSGKSLLFDGVVRKIYGEYGATLGQHQLESQYTDWRSQVLFGLFEEVLSRDQKYSHSGTLKHMITGETHRIEKKFVSGWEEANYMNAVFLSNEVQPFPLEESDRRFMVIWPEQTLPPEMQQAVVDEINNGGIESFYHYLLNLDLDGFGPHTKPLMTEAKERLIDFGRPGWDTFYREWRRGALEVPYQTCLASDLYKVYRSWAQENGERASISSTKFGGFLATKERRRRNLHYIDGMSSKKGTFFIIGQQPDGVSQQQWLGECVAEFQGAMPNGYRDMPQ